MTTQYKIMKINPNIVSPGIVWMDTGLTVTTGQVLTIVAKGRVNLWPSGLPERWASPEGAPFGNGITGAALPAALIGRIGSSGTAFKVGRFYNATASQTGALYLGVNDDNPGDNRGYFQARIVVGAPTTPTHNASCADSGYDKKKQSANPLELSDGNKVVSAVDIMVQTPAGPLTLERGYNQARRTDANYQFMGLGWSHNHAYKLVISGTVAQVFSPQGGALTLDDSGSTGHFVARPGSNAVLDASGSNYVLMGQDKRKLTFEPSGVSGAYRLKTLDWPSNETWTYTYSSSTGKLTEVDDGYGRKLKFSYVSASGQYHDGQLWRVGDHTASGLDTTTPSGRYVEYAYTPQKSNGTTISTPKALLASVHDVRANIWKYDYYGQQSGEANTAKLDFMTKRKSPSLDGTPAGELTLEELLYTLSGSAISAITQKRGNNLLVTDFTFQASGQNQTTEVTAGKTTTHYLANGVYLGPASGDGEDDLLEVQVLNENYRPMAQIDSRGNETQLDWSTDGKLLNQVTDALGAETNFTYNTSGAAADTLDYSLDAAGRKTKYIYGDTTNPRLPTEVKVFNNVAETTLLSWQKFTYDSNGRTLTEKTLDPTDSSGNTVRQQVTRAYYTSGNGNGLPQTVTQEDLITPANNVTTTTFYDTYGRVVQTNQNTTFGNCTSSYTVYDAAGNVVASICNYDPGSNPAPTTAPEAVALFNAAFPDANRVTTYGYDTLGRPTMITTDAGATYVQTALTFYDALDRVIRSIASYDAATSGVSDPVTAAHSAFGHGTDNSRNLVTDTAYNARGQVRQQTDVLGNVTLFGYDDPGRLVKMVQNASYPTYNNDYTGTSPDPSLSGYGAGSYPLSGAPDTDLVTATVYDATGNVVKTVDALGVVNYTAFDGLNRPVKMVRSAKDTAVIGLYDNDSAYSAANDPSAAGYMPDLATDRDLIDLTEYNVIGQVKRTQDINGSWTLFGYDALGRQVKTIRSASQPTYNSATDPALASYSPSSDADLDLITTTTFDSTGRVLYTTDVQGQRHWSAYDGLNRVVKTIGNAVGTATDGGTNDPRSGSYTPSTDSDKDLITITTFDSSGRVQWTQDKLGNKTWYVYDDLNRVKKTIQNCTYTSGTPAPEDAGYTGSSDSDKDLITRTTYDAQGRVSATFDAAGNEMRYLYDVLGRRIKTMSNYLVQGASDPANWIWDATDSRWEDGSGNAITFGADKDQNHITATSYDLGGRVLITRDARGTPTSFTYDAAGRTLTVIQADTTSLSTTSYTCFDKASRVLRTIANYRPALSDPSPDARDGSGNWLFAPTTHGLHEDENLITTFTLDRLGRQTAVTDVMGNTTSMTYFKDGQLDSMTDPLGVVTVHRYDKVRRRTTAVTGYQSNGEDPALWVWDATDNRWEKSAGSAISHGTANDRNVIVRVTNNKQGQMTALRDPRGKQMTYTYDLLSRRTGLTNPLSHTWATAYTNPGSGTTRVTLTDPLSFQTRQDFDRAGRLTSLGYLSESPKLTPDISFTYDKLGSRTLMSESDGSATVRRTTYAIDKAYRLTSAGFDNDGNGTVDQTVSYQYDVGGLRTRLTLPGSLNVDYAYNAKGELTNLTDWSSQATTFAYNNVGRLLLVGRANGLNSRYRYDAGGRLRQLRHEAGSKTLGHFAYTVDGRGNRTQVLEVVPRATTGSTTLAASDNAIDYYMGTWTTSGAFKQSTNFSAALRLLFFGSQATLTMGTGPDHSIYDVVVNGALWQAFDGYAASSGEQAHTLTLDNEGPHLLEVRNRAEKNLASSGYKIRFKQLVTDASGPTYDAQTIAYTYDALARLANASYHPGANTAATTFRQYAYSFDLAGNRTQQVVTIAGTPTTTNYTYDAANRLTSDGTNTLTYDNAGRLTSNGVNAYTWDRANQLLTYNGTAYQYVYDGDGRRIKQTVSGTATQYLLDIQPGLTMVMESTTGANTTRYVSGPMGLLEQQKPSATWIHPIMDGLGSVRGIVDTSMVVLQTSQFSPYGELYGQTGISQTDFGFTGEQTDGNGLLYLRARYYTPTLGVFLKRDVLQTLNSYEYANSNPINFIDPNGMLPCDTSAGQDQNCLNRIYGILSEKAYNAQLLGVAAHTSGGTVASRAMWHYLDASGSTEYWQQNWIDPELHRKTADLIQHAFENTPFFKNMCIGSCCSATGTTSLGNLVQNPKDGIRGRRYFNVAAGETPDWYPHLPDFVKGELVTKDTAGNEYIDNPYYSAMGGITVNSAGPSNARVISQSSSTPITIEVTTPIEYYDYYDWFFGGCKAKGNASGTHPFNMRLGHFMALEKASKAKPFNWYSYADITNTFSITCVGSQAMISNQSFKVEQGPQLNKPVNPPCNTPVLWNDTTLFKDDWPLATIAAKFKDSLFPTDKELSHEGKVLVR
jgi:RHS repeat-associated protein